MRNQEGPIRALERKIRGRNAIETANSLHLRTGRPGHEEGTCHLVGIKEQKCRGGRAKKKVKKHSSGNSWKVSKNLKGAKGSPKKNKRKIRKTRQKENGANQR